MSAVEQGARERHVAAASGPIELLDTRCSRDDVRLLVTHSDGAIANTQLSLLPEELKRGDLVPVNDSATFAAALPGRLDGEAVRVHISTPCASDPLRRFVEVREPAGVCSLPFEGEASGEVDVLLRDGHKRQSCFGKRGVRVRGAARGNYDAA